MPSDHNLRRLQHEGVSIWLDTLSRQLLRSGEFAALIRDYSVTGATSNPTIFARAITGSDLYDDQLRSLIMEGAPDPQQLFFALALDDVREAAGSSARPTIRATGVTGSSRSSAPPISPTTPAPRLPKRSICGSASISQTF